MRELISGELDPRYVEKGHILYVDLSGGLWAVPFDAAQGELLGGAVPIFDFSRRAMGSAGPRGIRKTSSTLAMENSDVYGSH